MNLRNGLNGKTVQQPVVKVPEPGKGNVKVHMSALAMQLSRSLVLIIQNAPETSSSRKKHVNLPNFPNTILPAKMMLPSAQTVEENLILVKETHQIPKTCISVQLKFQTFLS